MNFKHLTLVVALFSIFIEAKATNYYFYVQFNSKNNSPYSLTNPSVYLSQRALNRRAFYNIAIDSTDLPVNPTYLSQINALDILVHSKTKWLNGVTISVSDSSKIELIKNLDFVKFVQYTGKTNLSGVLVAPKKTTTKTQSTEYGTAALQINMLNGSILHNEGYRGQGMVIAVIDGGFLSVNTNPGFDSLRSEGRLLGVKNFVDPAVDTFTESEHGANVLSTMAGNILDTYVGTAPKASYWLLQSEANNTESLVEPDLWVSAIEFADSVGADVSTSSLGYTVFDNHALDFTYANMDGKTSRASIAATMAVDKGILVFNSAGNEGNKAWHYIGSPADADKIITVGSVNAAGAPSNTSSFGPTADGRQKPELCAMGTSSSLLTTNGLTKTGSGTSFATPILAGMSTCFLQAVKQKKPSLSLADFKEIIFRNANLYSTPNYQMGYGIPNFDTAYHELLSLSINNPPIDEVSILVNKKSKRISVVIKEKIINQKITVKLLNITGSIVHQDVFDVDNFDIHANHLTTGIYILCINYGGKSTNKKILL